MATNDVNTTATTSAASTQQEDNLTYDSIFPSLPSSSLNALLNSAWGSSDSNIAKLQIKPHTITQVFHVPVEERRYDDGQAFGNETNQKCEVIAQQYGVKIEICCSKDQSLHIVLSGNAERVHEAKRQIISDLQKEIEVKHKVPREMHKFIIGKGGAVLKELQEKTCTSISIPKANDNSDYITISGPRDGIDSAIHEIQTKCDEQSKTGYERLKIPKIYHPWLRGTNNETLNGITSRTGAKINMPPLDLDKEEITITGDKEKVELAVAEVMKIVNDKKKAGIRKLEIQITKSQHKLIIGKNGSSVQDIFKLYDVYVLVPRTDQNSETITLFGEENKLGGALTQVYSKANSVITTQIIAPSWLHRYMIGEKGTNISKITADYPDTHVKFENDNKITLEGPPSEIEKVKERLVNITKELQQRLTFEEIPLDPKYYGHVIGKSYENVTRMKQEFGVQIRIPQENSMQSFIRIEGDAEGVQKAKLEIQELLKRVENERSKDIIIEQKFHSNLIGQAGKTIIEIRSKFNDVNISIPNAKEKSDVVTVRGNKNDVERCCKYLQQFIKDIEESNYKEEVHIFKDFHKMIIGKHGASIRKIRDETNTRIDVPSDTSESDTVVITGRKENVVKARKLIEDKVKELIKIEEDHVEISHALHTALIGRGGAIIKQVRRDCGGCIITFPPEDKPSDKITLKGPREDIERAKVELLKLAKYKNELTYAEDVAIKAEYHRYLVGRKGNNINLLREKYNVRIIFPMYESPANTNGDAAATTATNGPANPASDIITIIGKEEDVKKVKAELEATAKNLEEQITDEVQVDSKWHKNFTAKRGRLINKISEENCNVKISFPKAQTASNVVSLKGPKEAVVSAKKKILEVVYELENQVSIEVNIAQRHHNAVIGKKGVNSQKISEDFHVEIQFPAKLENTNERPYDRQQQQAPVSTPAQAIINGIGHENHENGDIDVNENVNDASESASTASFNDTVIISGLKENCEKAKEALLALVPISDQYEFPSEFHRNLLSNKATELREIGMQFNINIVVPRKGDESNYITLVGQRDNIEEAKKLLKERLEKFELDKKDNELRQFTTEFEIKPEYIQFLRGKLGAEAKKLGEQYQCRVDFSRKGEPVDKVVLRGYEKNVYECKDEILRRIAELESKVMQEISIDSRVVPRIIGAQGKNSKKISEKYGVEIKFQGKSDVVIVKGDSEEKVEDCCDYLKNLEEEYLQDVIDREQYTRPSRMDEGEKPVANTKGFIVKGAPWEQPARHGGQQQQQQHVEPVVVPDTTNLEDFPSITSSVGANASGSKASAWGPSRR